MVGWLEGVREIKDIWRVGVGRETKDEKRM